jgi:hypothetical protein
VRLVYNHRALRDAVVLDKIFKGMPAMVYRLAGGTSSFGLMRSCTQPFFCLCSPPHPAAKDRLIQKWKEKIQEIIKFIDPTNQR